MNTNVCKWNKKDLTDLRSRLLSLADEKYREFHMSLCKTSKLEIIGIRLPIIRSIAKEILKNSPELFIKNVKCRYYEEQMLKALVTAGEKKSFSQKRADIERLIPEIDNWAVCDTFCSALKPKKDELDEVFLFVKEHIFGSYEYEIRTAVVLSMNYLVTEKYIDELLSMYEKTDCSYYYTSMAVAWALSVCFVKFRDETLAFIKSSNLDKLTFNRTIQKIIDSYRVSAEDKALVKAMRK